MCKHNAKVSLVSTAKNTYNKQRSELSFPSGLLSSVSLFHVAFFYSEQKASEGAGVEGK